ncbi:MAG: hypothetical protein M0R77_18820 [Gammaproteobacteria bacterium]|nr:hypothetical protein [Gammaproteobacteria bacterium]
MLTEDILKIVGAIAASFGGGAVIVIALSGWLGNLWAKRILQTEQAILQAQIEELRHEMGLVKSSYERYLDLMLDYYTVFYRHYRLCQRAANADAYRSSEGEITFTQDEFLAGLDSFLTDWSAQEGKIRLLLPSEALAVHSEAIDAFNRFKRSVVGFRKDDETRKAKQDAFASIEDVKRRMEDTIRKFLRTEKLLK